MPHSIGHLLTRPSRLAGWTIAMLVVALTVAIYMPGLHGPFLLDDIGNLDPLKRWLDGSLTWQGVVFDNRSGPGGRPLSMLSFLADAARTAGLDSGAFKTTNLAIHLLTGIVAFVLVRQILHRAAFGERTALLCAAFVAVAWLWLPIQVSTVLYVVQRMAQLAALFTFAALALYLHARRGIMEGRRSAQVMLWIGVPLLTLLAALAKENGALALPLAATLEFTLFQKKERSASVRAFLVLTVVIPALAATAFVAVRPDLITRGYAIRDFTLEQRLLTEPRILWSYLQTSFFPVGPRMGLYHDNYPVSVGLFQPLSTAAALLAWSIVVGWAVAWRRKAPLFTLGVFAYLVGHSLEGGPISLELYFEHRNYAPILFALLALVGLARVVLDESRASNPRTRRFLAICGGTALVFYGLGTANQAYGWADARTFYAVQYGYNPTSPRLLSSLTGTAILSGDLDNALRYIDQGDRYSPASEKATATLWRFLAYCESARHVPAPSALYDEFDARAHGRITTYGMVAWELLSARIMQGCPALDTSRIATTGARWVGQASQPSSDQSVWRTRYNLARMVAHAGDLRAARDMAHTAWEDSDHNNGVGVFLFQLDASLGDVPACEKVLAALEHAEGGPDKRLNQAIVTFREALRSGQIGKGSQ